MASEQYAKDESTFLLFPQVEISQESVWIDFNIHTNTYDLWKRKEETTQLSKFFEMNSPLQRSENSAILFQEWQNFKSKISSF